MIRIADKNKRLPPQTLMMVAGSNSPPNFNIDPREPYDEPKAKPMEELMKLAIDPQESTKVLKLRKNLEGKVKEELESFLKDNSDVFARKHSNRLGISPEVI